MKNFLLLISFLFFGLFFGQNTAELDNTFDSMDYVFHSGGSKMIKLSNGKFIVLGGGVSAYKNFVYPASSLYRLNSDFTPDPTFNLMVINRVYDFDVQTDGKIIIAGNFTTVNGVSVNKIARLNSNGFLDSTFNFANSTGLTNFTIYGLHAVKISSSGKILVGGKVNISGKGDLFRLNSNGTLDNTFSSGVNAGNNTISHVIDFEIDSSGKIVFMTRRDLDGLGTTVNDVVFNVGRRLANGANDTSFSIPNTFFSGNLIPNWKLPKIRFQNDGKIVIKTYFSVGTSCWRLTSSGAVDTSFTVPISLSEDFEVLNNGNFLLANVNGFSVYNAAGTLLSSNVNEENIKLSKMFLQPSGEVITTIYWEVPPPAGINQTVHKGKLVVYDQSGNLIPTVQKGTYYAGKKIIQKSSNEILVLGNIKWDGGVKNHFGIKLVNNQGQLVINPNLENFLNSNIDFNDDINYIKNGWVQTDGKIILQKVKRFGSPGNYYNEYAFIRINNDYSIDSSYNVFSFTDIYDGLSSIVLQPDNKLLLGFKGSFNGDADNKVYRINEDGTYDYDFINNQSGLNDSVYSLKLQADGKILVAGRFDGFYSGTGNTTVLNGIMRLNSDGTIDTTFISNFSTSFITAIETQSDGKIIIGGDVYNSGANSYFISRLNQNGMFDATFTNVNSQNDQMYHFLTKIKIFPDDSIMVIDDIKTNGSITSSTLIKLLNNGNVDSSFNTGIGFDGIIADVLPQADGRLLVTGDFEKYNDVLCNGTVRLIGNYNSLSQSSIIEKSNSNFVLFPNPAGNFLNISKKEEIEISSITIYNMLGQIVVAIPNAKNIENVDVSSLKSGNYFVKINSDKGTSNTKFIKL